MKTYVVGGAVRDALLGMQRSLGRDGGVVLEGRDIGTVVFPNAEAKFKPISKVLKNSGNSKAPRLQKSDKK